MPAHARAVKKYFGSTFSGVSKISDNKDATASLGHSEKLRVKNSIRDPIPEDDHCPEDGTKIPSAVARQYSGDVLPKDPSRLESVEKSNKFKGEVTSLIFKPSTKARKRKRLARRAADEQIDVLIRSGFDRREITVQGRMREAMREHGAGKWVDLREKRRVPIKGLPCDGSGLDTRTDGAISEHISIIGRCE